MPAEECVGPRTTVTEVDRRRPGGEGILDLVVDGHVLVPHRVLLDGRCARVDDVGFHQHAGLDEALPLGCRQELGVLADGMTASNACGLATREADHPCADTFASLPRWLNSLTMRRLRSEEHTSELQSQFHLVCRLLLEKKKINSQIVYNVTEYIRLEAPEHYLKWA